MLTTLICLAWFAAGAAGETLSQTTLSGGDLPQPVTLAAADEDAFLRRINLPPKLDDPPATAGTGYAVESPYWVEVLSVNGKAAAETRAVYYPNGGFVNARQGGEDVWLVLDLRQRALLDRYIRLARLGRLSASPGMLEVLGAAAVDEVIGIDIGSRSLDEAERAAFWRGAAGLRPSASVAGRPGVSGGRPEGLWIVFSLPEGRSVQALYYETGGVAYLTDSTLSEIYALPNRWLEPVLGEGGASGLGLTRVPQASGSGSKLWWVVLAGGGGACLALAAWLRARQTRRA